MLIYVPKNVVVLSGVPVLVWIHGGSFLQGSATGPGLDGSNLAVSTNSIVVVIQYRLGGVRLLIPFVSPTKSSNDYIQLGFLSANSGGNYGVQDAVASLKFINKYIGYFGGSASKVTIAGQSAGANLVRALLAVPSASSLFASAILQSDPMVTIICLHLLEQNI
jgi:carboxylesterase type B